MFKVEQHRLGVCVYVFGLRIHEWHLGRTVHADMDADRSATATFTVTTSTSPPPAPRRCVVPSVKGKTLAAAKHLIRARHCSVGSIRTAYSGRRTGTIISQKPGPRTKLRAGSRVNLVVSKGPKKR